MTATLPEFNGHPVSRAAIKITGAGTGLSEGLKVQPIVLDVGEEESFVIRGRCVGVEHSEDKNELLVRIHKLNTVDIAPIGREIADRALQEQAQRIEEAKRVADGQTSIDDELAAQQREDADGTAQPGDVAVDAAERVKSGP